MHTQIRQETLSPTMRENRYGKKIVFIIVFPIQKVKGGSNPRAKPKGAPKTVTKWVNKIDRSIDAPTTIVLNCPI